MDDDELTYNGSIKGFIDLNEQPSNKYAAEFMSTMSAAYSNLVHKLDNKELKEYAILMSDILKRVSDCYLNLHEGETKTDEMDNIHIEKVKAEGDFSKIKLTEEEAEIMNDFRENGLNNLVKTYIKDSLKDGFSIITKEDESYDC